MDMLDEAKVEKLKEVRRILRELIANGEGDDAMSGDEMDEIMEDAEEASETQDEQALEDAGMEADSAMGQEAMEGDLSEEDKLRKMKQEYFKPKMPKIEPKKGVAKIVVKGRL